MKADKMTHPTLERHGEQWRHKKRIPTDVLPHFGGVKTLTFSTKTADAREARTECLRWLADVMERIQGLRRVAEGGLPFPFGRDSLRINSGLCWLTKSPVSKLKSWLLMPPPLVVVLWA